VLQLCSKPMQAWQQRWLSSTVQTSLSPTGRRIRKRRNLEIAGNGGNPVQGPLLVIQGEADMMNNSAAVGKDREALSFGADRIGLAPGCTTRTRFGGFSAFVDGLDCRPLCGL